MSQRPTRIDKFDWLELQKQAMDYGDGEMPGFFEFLMRDEMDSIRSEQPTENTPHNATFTHHSTVKTSAPDEEGR